MKEIMHGLAGIKEAGRTPWRRVAGRFRNDTPDILCVEDWRLRSCKASVD